MNEVSRDVFLAAIYADPRDIHPRVEKDASYWETRNRVLVGKSTPGYLCTGRKAYFLPATTTQ